MQDYHLLACASAANTSWTKSDAQAIEWCLKSLATGKTFWFTYVDLASAYAWRGQNAEAGPRLRSS